MISEYKLDKSDFTNELRMLLEILSMDVDPIAGTNAQKLSKDIDWQRFLELTLHHRVYPIIYTRLNSMNQLPIPKDVMDALQEAYKKNTYQMMKLTAEMGRVCNLFAENDVRSIVLKGPVVAEALYGDLSMRTSKDLDILVSLEDVELVERILIDQGYHFENSFIKKLKEWRVASHLVFNHPKLGVQIEIHWIMHSIMEEEPSFLELWDRSRKSSLSDGSVYYLGEDDLFIYLVNHGAKHAWFRLRWLVDIKMMLLKMDDWKSIEKFLIKYKYMNVATQALILACQMLSAPLSDEMRQLKVTKHIRLLTQGAVFFICDESDVHSIRTPRYVRRNLQKYQNLMRTNRQRILLFVGIFTPKSVDAQLLPLPKPLHFLYYPLRPFLWAIRKVSKIRQGASN